MSMINVAETRYIDELEKDQIDVSSWSFGAKASHECYNIKGSASHSFNPTSSKIEMSAEYKLTIKIESKILQTLAGGQYTLCIQKALDANQKKASANIVSGTVAYNEYSSSNNFSWKTSYAAAATHQVYVEGGSIDGSSTTEVVPIATNNKDAFVLNSWSNWEVKPGSSVAPDNGFAFLPDAKGIPLPGATLVVYMNSLSVQGGAAKQVPYWMSPLQYAPGSENSLVPIEQMTVFFSQVQLTPGAMISQGKAYNVVIDFTDQPNHTYLLKNDTTWVKEV